MERHGQPNTMTIVMRTRPSPAISVLLLSQNHKRVVEEAVRSALCQTWTDLEIVLLDNRSSDGSWEALNACADGREMVRLVRPGRRLSIPGALNFGLENSCGRYIAPLDSDDAWAPERLERQMRFMDDPANNDVGVCGSNCLLMDAKGRPCGVKDYPPSHEACMRALWFRNPICHSAALIRRECFERLGGYDENFELVQDLELWFRIGQAYRLANLPERLTRVRVSDSNASIRFHRQVVVRTLVARRHAIAWYGYQPGALAHAAMAATWCMKWLPGRMVRRVFNGFFLPYCRFLWDGTAEQRSSVAAFSPALASGQSAICRQKGPQAACPQPTRGELS